MRTLPLLVALALVPLPALAGKPGKGHEGHKDKGHESVTIVVTEREKVRTYFVEKHGRGNCPPGLAKKNDGCLPPGQAKKRYVVGQPLPAAVEIVEVPRELSVNLAPPPPGYRYGIVDGDFVQITISGRIVVDVVVGLVD